MRFGTTHFKYSFLPGLVTLWICAFDDLSMMYTFCIKKALNHFSQEFSSLLAPNKIMFHFYSVFIFSTGCLWAGHVTAMVGKAMHLFRDTILMDVMVCETCP